MKKFFIILILCLLELPVSAVNFTYKVYDKRMNKSFSAILGTVAVNQENYLFAFFTQEGRELCLIGEGLTPIEKHDGLVGGKCLPRYILLNPTKYTSDNDKLLKNVLDWRELSKNTFFTEINDIRRERLNDGLIELKLEE